MRRTNRLISILILTSFLIEQASFAADLKPQAVNLFQSQKLELDFNLPESVASIEDSWKGSDSNQTIFLLQDAHTNESGQINLAKTLDTLLKEEKGLKYIFVEAGVGDDSLSFLRKYSSLDKRKQVATEYLKKGILHGEEYLDITSNHDFVIWGVEDMTLYQKAIDAYRSVVKGREKFQSYLSRIQMTIDTLKSRIFNSALLSFDEKYAKFLKENISLTDYFQILTQEAKKRDVSLLNFPHLQSLNNLKEKESKIDFKKANEEQQKAIQFLSQEDQKELMEYAKKKSPFKLGSQDHRGDKAFYTFLEEQLAKTINQYPELSKYFIYLKEAKTLNPKKILEEQKELENEIFNILAKTQDEQILLHCQKNLRSLQKLFDLKLTPEEYALYKEDSKDFTIRHLTGFLNKKIMDLQNFYERAMFLEESYDKIVKNSETFYELTKDRDEAFLRILSQKMNQEKQTKAVLIAGGFHTTNLKALFKEKNISHVSITPQVYEETNQKRYESLLLNQKINSDFLTSAPPYAQSMARLAAIRIIPDFSAFSLELGFRSGELDRIKAFPAKPLVLAGQDVAVTKGARLADRVSVDSILRILHELYADLDAKKDAGLFAERLTEKLAAHPDFKNRKIMAMISKRPGMFPGKQIVLSSLAESGHRTESAIIQDFTDDWAAINGILVAMGEEQLESLFINQNGQLVKGMDKYQLIDLLLEKLQENNGMKRPVSILVGANRPKSDQEIMDITGKQNLITELEKLPEKEIYHDFRIKGLDGGGTESLTIELDITNQKLIDVVHEKTGSVIGRIGIHDAHRGVSHRGSNSLTYDSFKNRFILYLRPDDEPTSGGKLDISGVHTVSGQTYFSTGMMAMAKKGFPNFDPKQLIRVTGEGAIRIKTLIEVRINGDTLKGINSEFKTLFIGEISTQEQSDWFDIRNGELDAYWALDPNHRQNKIKHKAVELAGVTRRIFNGFDARLQSHYLSEAETYFKVRRFVFFDSWEAIERDFDRNPERYADGLSSLIQTSRRVVRRGIREYLSRELEFEPRGGEQELGTVMLRAESQARMPDFIPTRNLMTGKKIVVIGRDKGEQVKRYYGHTLNAISEKNEVIYVQAGDGDRDRVLKQITDSKPYVVVYSNEDRKIKELIQEYVNRRRRGIRTLRYMAFGEVDDQNPADVSVYQMPNLSVPGNQQTMGILDKAMKEGHKSQTPHEGYDERKHYEIAARYFAEAGAAEARLRGINYADGPYAHNFAVGRITGDGVLLEPDPSLKYQPVMIGEKPKDGFIPIWFMRGQELISLSPHADDTILSYFMLGAWHLRNGVLIKDHIITPGADAVKPEDLYVLEEVKTAGLTMENVRKNLRWLEAEKAARIITDELKVDRRAVSVEFHRADFNSKDAAGIMYYLLRKEIENHLHFVEENKAFLKEHGIEKLPFVLTMPPENDPHPRHLSVTKAAISTLRRLAKRKNVEIVFMTYPSVWAETKGANTFFQYPLNPEKDIGNDLKERRTRFAHAGLSLISAGFIGGHGGRDLRLEEVLNYGLEPAIRGYLRPSSGLGRVVETAGARMAENNQSIKSSELARIVDSLSASAINRVGQISLPTTGDWKVYRKFSEELAKGLSRKIPSFMNNEYLINGLEFGILHGIYNAVVHGNQFNNKKRVSISWRVTDKQLVLKVVDRGTGPIKEDSGIAVVDRGEAISGRGEALGHMRSIFDQVHLSPLLGLKGVKVGAELILVKDLVKKDSRLAETTRVSQNHFFNEYLTNSNLSKGNIRTAQDEIFNTRENVIDYFNKHNPNVYKTKDGTIFLEAVNEVDIIMGGSTNRAAARDDKGNISVLWNLSLMPIQAVEEELRANTNISGHKSVNISTVRQFKDAVLEQLSYLARLKGWNDPGSYQRIVIGTPGILTSDGRIRFANVFGIEEPFDLREFIKRTLKDKGWQPDQMPEIIVRNDMDLATRAERLDRFKKNDNLFAAHDFDFIYESLGTGIGLQFDRLSFEVGSLPLLGDPQGRTVKQAYFENGKRSTTPEDVNLIGVPVENILKLLGLVKIVHSGGAFFDAENGGAVKHLWNFFEQRGFNQEITEVPEKLKDILGALSWNVLDLRGGQKEIFYTELHGKFSKKIKEKREEILTHDMIGSSEEATIWLEGMDTWFEETIVQWGDWLGAQNPSVFEKGSRERIETGLALWEFMRLAYLSKLVVNKSLLTDTQILGHLNLLEERSWVLIEEYAHNILHDESLASWAKAYSQAQSASVNIGVVRKNAAWPADNFQRPDLSSQEELVKNHQVAWANDILVTPSDVDIFGEVAAQQVGDEIRRLQELRKGNINVIFATGNTMKPFLRYLVQQSDIDWTRINAFHLDEYRGLSISHPASFARFLQDNLFDPLRDKDPRNHIIEKNIYRVTNFVNQDGKEINDYHEGLEAYIAKLENLGGADIIMLGLGRDGHIAFVKEGTPFNEGMQMVDLSEETLTDNELDYPGIRDNPFAFTMGPANLMPKGKIFFLVNKEGKSATLSEVLLGELSTDKPAKVLRTLPEGRVTAIFDKAAASVFSSNLNPLAGVGIQRGGRLAESIGSDVLTSLAGQDVAVTKGARLAGGRRNKIRASEATQRLNREIGGARMAEKTASEMAAEVAGYSSGERTDSDRRGTVRGTGASGVSGSLNALNTWWEESDAKDRDDLVWELSSNYATAERALSNLPSNHPLARAIRTRRTRKGTRLAGFNKERINQGLEEFEKDQNNKHGVGSKTTGSRTAIANWNQHYNVGARLSQDLKVFFNSDSIANQIQPDKPAYIAIQTGVALKLYLLTKSSDGLVTAREVRSLGNEAGSSFIGVFDSKDRRGHIQAFWRRRLANVQAAFSSIRQSDVLPAVSLASSFFKKVIREARDVNAPVINIESNALAEFHLNAADRWNGMPTNTALLDIAALFEARASRPKDRSAFVLEGVESIQNPVVKDFILPLMENKVYSRYFFKSSPGRGGVKVEIHNGVYEQSNFSGGSLHIAIARVTKDEAAPWGRALNFDRLAGIFKKESLIDQDGRLTARDISSIQKVVNDYRLDFRKYFGDFSSSDLAQYLAGLGKSDLFLLKPINIAYDLHIADLAAQFILRSA